MDDDVSDDPGGADFHPDDGFSKPDLGCGEIYWRIYWCLHHRDFSAIICLSGPKGGEAM